MSGLVATYHLDGRPVDRAALQVLVDHMAHRGPDGAGVWTDGPVGLGHRMLRTTPAARFERQPAVAGPLVVTADARLDNRDELLDLLGLPRSADRPIPDAELIGAAYAKWGEDCPGRLLGAFAFVVWDGARRRLFAARDPFGVRPLYYAHRPGRFFRIASETAVLFAGGGVSREQDDLKVAEHLLVPVHPDGARTYFREVRALPPAHTLTVTPDGLHTRRYYALDPEREVRLASDAEYAEAFRALFAEAVRCRMTDDGTTGTMLSGGIDSTAVACMAATLAGPGAAIPAFSAQFDAVPESDERGYQQAAVDHYGFPHHVFHADRVGPFAGLEAVHRTLDRPSDGSNLYIHWHLQRMAAERGVRVLLDGFDGDTTVSHGKGYLYELRARGRLWALAREVKAWAEFKGYPWRPVVRHWVRASARGRLRALPGVAALRRWRRPPADPAPRMPRGLAPDFAARLTGDLLLPEPKPTTERQHHLMLLQRADLSQACATLNHTASAFGLEPRFPFFDRRLIEFCLALPPEQKLRRGVPRFILRNALTGILPPEVQWRGKKADISPSFLYGMRRYGRPLLEAFPGEGETVAGQFVDLDWYRGLARGVLDGTERGEGVVYLWRALTLTRWLAAPEPVPRPVAPETLLL